MPNEKKPEFIVNDRRQFTVEGELRPENATEEQPPTQQAEAPVAAPPAAPVPESAVPPTEPPAAPSAREHQEQAERYRESSRDLESHLQRELDSQGQGRKASEFEMTFEKFVASLYMTALMQLGLVQEQGMQPGADLVGARQTIDTISLIADKTRGNLTPVEENILTNCLYELRMAYVELTNTLAHPPAGKGSGPDSRLK